VKIGVTAPPGVSIVRDELLQGRESPQGQERQSISG
jgi:sRNA-binding carbon storage regulator CsrA